ncbi:hypothetical protein CAPTEDRAFT_200161, partial [Capitella teleta]
MENGICAGISRPAKPISKLFMTCMCACKSIVYPVYPVWVNAKVLYDFQCEGEGELSVYSNELVTIIKKKDVGDGWWEVMNVNGESGLVPEAYLEQVFSVPEPSHPPPPPPQTY